MSRTLASSFAVFAALLAALGAAGRGEPEGLAMCVSCNLVRALASSAVRLAVPARAYAAESTAPAAAHGNASPPATPASTNAAPAAGDAGTTTGDAAKATLVLLNGAVYTVGPKRPWVEAVAVREKTIVAVGSKAEVNRFVGEETKVVDLAGRMLLPGFVEGHMHPLVGSFFTAGVDLQVESREQALEAIARYARENPADRSAASAGASTCSRPRARAAPTSTASSPTVPCSSSRSTRTASG